MMPLRFTPRLTLPYAALLLGCVVVLSCGPDESPVQQETERLRKQVAKQDSMIVSLQEGNKVMQQQIDLLNQELREARQDAEEARAAHSAIAAKLDVLNAENRRLVAQANREATKKAALAQGLRLATPTGQVEELAHQIAAVYRATEAALSKNGYALRLSVLGDQRAVYVTERKTSLPSSLEVPGFRNQYLVSMDTLPKGTRVHVKADFEKLAQGNRLLPAAPEEVADIERRLIAEIVKALNEAGKV